MKSASSNPAILLFIGSVLLVAAGCNSGRPEKEKENATAVQTENGSVKNKKGTGPDPVHPTMNKEQAQEQLFTASLEGYTEQVGEAISLGVDVNLPDPDGRTPLMFAAFNGHNEILMMLIDHGASLARRDLMGRTALLYAATGPFPETVRILLDKGAEPNVVDSDEHFSPLMHAAAEGNLEVVKILLEAGANPELKDVDGDDAESFARQAGHTAVAEYLAVHR